MSHQKVALFMIKETLEVESLQSFVSTDPTALKIWLCIIAQGIWIALIVLKISLTEYKMSPNQCDDIFKPIKDAGNLINSIRK